jgi:choline transport protein
LFIAPSKITITVQISLYGSIVGFVICFITNLAMSGPKQPASWVTEAGLGTSGWGDGTAWLLGITNAMYAYGGTDGGACDPHGQTILETR